MTDTDDEERKAARRARIAAAVTPRGNGGMSGYERVITAHADARQARRRPADWSLWRDKPTALVWQAVALSLDTDPDPNPPEFLDCFPQDFQRRMRIAQPDGLG